MSYSKFTDEHHQRLIAEGKRAPVQGWPGGIPWSLHLEAYAAYCKKWSPQDALIDLDGRHCRGGFGTGELDEFIRLSGFLRGNEWEAYP